MGVPIKPAFGPSSKRSPQEYREHQHLVNQLNNKLGPLETATDSQSSSLAALTARVVELEQRLSLGYIIGRWVGATRVALDPLPAAGGESNLRVTGSTVNSVDFAFLTKFPPTGRYVVQVCNQDGTASFATCSITANTTTGFRVRPLAGVAIFDPRSAVVEIELIVIVKP
jgi:hypothetical protein